MVKETPEQRLARMMQEKNPSTQIPDVIKSRRKFSFSISLSLLNKLLTIAIVVVGVMVYLEFQRGMGLVNQEVVIEQVLQGDSQELEVAIVNPPEISFYLNRLQTRNIFRPYEQPAEKKITTLTTKLSKYRLVGVSWLDLPETATVMIEDSATQQTLFLKQGDQLEGVTIKTIYTDRVLLGDDNEETIIKL